LKLN
jgi:hypothetical protein